MRSEPCNVWPATHGGKSAARQCWHWAVWAITTSTPRSALALLDDDRTVRILAENSIRQVWTRVAVEKDRVQLSTIIRLNAARQFDKVIRMASDLIGRVPDFAEAWNQRAYAHHALGHYDQSVRDCHEALEINPYHFIAAVGMGRGYLELGNPASALESFRRALRLNPDLEGVRVQADRLAKMVEGT